ncbi:MAG: tetratricopeptide repeat protein [bacterium]
MIIRRRSHSIANRIAALAALALFALVCVLAPSCARAQEKKLEEITRLPRHEQEDLLQAYVAAHPDDAEGHFAFGNWLYDEYRTTDAVTSYEKALALNPDHFRALVNAALVLENAGRGEESLEMYEEFLARHPNDARALAHYGETQWTLGRRSQAVDSFRKALSIDAHCAEAHFHMGVAFAEMGILREAIREWEHVVKAGEPKDLAARSRENITKAKEKL